jgi:DUF2934 family protein
MRSASYKGGELVMLTKTRSASRPTQRATRNPTESRGNENIITSQPAEHFQDTHARISEQAYGLYEEHGRVDGHDLEDWLEAERQVLKEG